MSGPTGPGEPMGHESTREEFAPPRCAICGRMVIRLGDRLSHTGRGPVASCDLDADHRPVLAGGRGSGDAPGAAATRG